MQEPETPHELVRLLVFERISVEGFASLSLDHKRKFQCLVVVRKLIERGHAHGIGAVDPAVKVCKETSVGTGWFLGQKISAMLARALVGTGVSSMSKGSESTEAMTWACDQIIDAIVLQARR
jgi:hypothetical protein